MKPFGAREFVLIVVAALAVTLGCSQSEPLGARVVVEPPAAAEMEAQNSAWLAELEARGRPGYWLVIRGYKEADHFIVAMTNTPLSHAAVLDMERGVVIESMSPGVIETSLSEFLTHAHRVLLIEPMWWTPERGAAAVEEARELVGSKYDFTGLIGLSDDERFYCSELAFHVYSAYQSDRDHVPKVIEPGQMYLWGQVLWDSRPRD